MIDLPPEIIIVSPQPDFAQAIQEHVTMELGLACSCADSLDAAASRLQPGSIVISDMLPQEPYAAPVIQLKPLPLSLQSLLDDVISARLKKNPDSIALGSLYQMQLRQKSLLHIKTSATVTLTDKEAQLLECLHQAGSAVVPKEELLKRVWGIDAALETHTLETHIYRLRAKVRELGGQDDFITAAAGGYCLQG